jgi:copper chaperone
MTQQTITVQGMTCGGCEQSIQRAVTTLDGVDEVRADHRAGRVTVRFDADIVGEESIGERIREVGYTVA